MNFLSRLFKKETPVPPADLSVLKVDVHSHFIPGIDDGAKTIEDSIALITEFQNLGYQKVITTPHVMSDYYKNTPEIILSGLENVRKAARQAGLTIQIEAAAEYYLDPEFEKLVDAKNLLTFGNNYVLFEMPFLSAPHNLYQCVFKLQANGYKPVLAHPERYSFWLNDFDKYIDLKEKGVLLQLNINSLTGHYSPETKKLAEKFIDLQMIEFLGSDCHNMNHAALMRHARVQKYLHKLVDSGNLLNTSLL